MIDYETFRKELESKVTGANKPVAFTAITGAMATVNAAICEVIERPASETLSKGVKDATELADALRLMVCVSMIASELAIREAETVERLRDDMARALARRN